jgi:hypothetical protein
MVLEGRRVVVSWCNHHVCSKRKKKRKRVHAKNAKGCSSSRVFGITIGMQQNTQDKSRDQPYIIQCSNNALTSLEERFIDLHCLAPLFLLIVPLPFLTDGIFCVFCAHSFCGFCGKKMPPHSAAPIDSIEIIGYPLDSFRKAQHVKVY